MRMKVTIELEYDADPKNYPEGEDPVAVDQKGFEDNLLVIQDMIGNGDPVIKVEKVSD